jgi:hypothetical protein
MVSIPALMGNTFVIKAHAGPTSCLASALDLGLACASPTFTATRAMPCFRHTISVSARLRRDDPMLFPISLISTKSVDFMMEYVRIWEKWMREKNVLVARYEDLLTNYDVESAKLVEYLKLDGSKPEVRAVIEQYRPGANDGQQGLHFYKGKIGRFREAYTEAQQNSRLLA